MDVISATAAAAAGGGGGGGGPAPFLLKTYEMIDDSQTDDIVSWTPTGHSFVVWNPPEFARILLPTYFKHNNFSSFIRQLNTYGFRKIDPERWEFANEEFVKDQKHLLKNIHRRKPIHSHSHPPGSTVDPERAAFEEEIDKLSREKSGLEANVLRFRQQQSAAKLQLEEMTERVGGIEQRQESLLTFVEKAVLNPDFVQRLAQKLESMDISAFSKKRRLPQVDSSQPVQENMSVDNHSSSRVEFGNLCHQDFSNKLRLELSPAVSDINVVSCSTQSSNEDGGSPHRRISEGWSREVQLRTGGVIYTPEAIELSDTGTSFTLKMDSSLPRAASNVESSRLHSLPQSLISNEEVDACQLNLSLASCLSQVDKNQHSVRMPQIGQEIGKHSESQSDANGKNPPNDDKTLPLSHDATNNKQGAATTQVRVNDVFWEQFLTERPGCSDNEEASSSFKGNSYDEQDDRKSSQGVASNTRKVEHLTL
ncbi:PREDICTED: heat stress transcription factor A-5 [Nicotiana attenuata]|uniref:Heat stress transcription factor n=1 Tax=Nicotiana attenuata TaxID=49451 RepID=A0A1J6IF49_NICAT|nr:PREDICTED: heat stress transcription factor A-5 [Nicotiana attenuata]OIS96382.1 heat stress transcription factor a-5 [Nicotiana attenuata]